MNLRIVDTRAAAAGIGRTEVERAVRDGDCHLLLAYGEVRVEHGAITIGMESLMDITPSQRRLFEQSVAAAGVDPNDVLVVRVTEAGIEVDIIDMDDERWLVRTVRVTSQQLHQTAQWCCPDGSSLPKNIEC